MSDDRRIDVRTLIIASVVIVAAVTTLGALDHQGKTPWLDAAGAHEGDPLEVTTLAQRVFIEGQSQPMQSRQTLLRDRYLEKLRAHAAR